MTHKSNLTSHHLSPLKPKSANVLGAVNKPLSSAGKQLQSKASRMETASNEDSSSNPGSPQRSKTRYEMHKDGLTKPRHQPKQTAAALLVSDP